MNNDEILAAHRAVQGKIETKSKVSIKNAADLALYYTPGVGRVSSLLAKHPDQAGAYTINGNTVAVISDGSAVLGLGNVGPYAALPVMEGKAALMKELAGVNAVPIVLDTQDPRVVIETIRAIAPTFAGINLEDIASPQCYEIEAALQDIGIPVVHDDQHATAIVVLAGLINAFHVAEKTLGKSKIVIVGAGAAGSAIARLLHLAGVKNILVVDSKGIVSRDREDIDPFKKRILSYTNPVNITGTLDDAIIRADAVVGVAAAGLIKPEHIKAMNDRPVVFALSNPDPEIMPDEAKEAGAFIVATGRSDFPNQINNVLVFPGMFRGAIDHGVATVTDMMKLTAAKNLAHLVKEPTAEMIIPSAFDPGVVNAIAGAIK